jgi:hypothetical protein
LTGLAGANVSGFVPNANVANTAFAVAAANVSGLGNVALINKDGNASNILYGNGAFASAPSGATYGNSNVATFLASYGSNTMTTTGNVSVGNIIGNGQALTGLAGANVTGQVGNALVAGTVYTAAQSNITSVGTLTSLSVSGNATVGNIITNNYMIHSVGTSISAAGTNQGTGTSLTKEINIVSTVASGSGVVLPTAVAGMIINVTNTNANTLLVYPASGAQINSLGTNAGFSQGTTTIQFIAPTTTQWYTVGATYA